MLVCTHLCVCNRIHKDLRWVLISYFLFRRVLLPALSCVQTCLLHLLDMSWEVLDLPLFEDIKLPELLLAMSQENISVHDIAIRCALELSAPCWILSAVLYSFNQYGLISLLEEEKQDCVQDLSVLSIHWFVLPCLWRLCSQWTEEDEIADYERNTEWMDECMDGMFEKWFDKIAQASAEDKRKVDTPEMLMCRQRVFLPCKTFTFAFSSWSPS